MNKYTFYMQEPDGLEYEFHCFAESADDACIICDECSDGQDKVVGYTMEVAK